MSEEEQKVIDYFKEFQKELYGYSSKSQMAIYLDVLFNYINKLQKENEDMREELQMYVDTDVMKLQDENEHLKEQLQISNSLDNMYKLYISKDTIREKIKELEEDREKVRNLYEPSDDDSEFIQTYQILALKELLKED